MSISEDTAAHSTASGIRVDIVRIANFRSLRNIEVELGDIALLVGMNNTGKTSFLKAVHLALSADRRTVSPDDFFVDASGAAAEKIVIDVRIVPVESDRNRTGKFAQHWIDHDLGGNGLIQVDSDDQEFVAFRTIVTRDAVKNDFSLERRALAEWPDFAYWQACPKKSRVPRFEQIASFFIDAQRDAVNDLRTRSSYLGRLLSKIEIPETAIAELEERLRHLNDDIVSQSEVLKYIRDVLAGLNRTVSAFGEGVEINPVSKNLRELTKGMGVQFADHAGSSFPLESHGMGTRSWASLLSFDAYVSWTGKLAEREGLPFHPVLFLEEPEAHLHPNAQRSVQAQLARGVGQRIVSTHSPYIAGQANLGEIRYFAKRGSETRIQRIAIGELDANDERKIRREIMRSRGELLFAAAVVLFEGETEEQALPMFARRHWGQYPFERGIVFVGVGGEGNYGPFLRIFETLQIRWFIFSDGEPNARKKVSEALRSIDSQPENPHLVTIPNDRAIEGYLIDEGYQQEVKKAIIDYLKPSFFNGRHEESKRAEVAAWTDTQLIDFMKQNKVGIATYWATRILDCNNERAIPASIRDLFNCIDQTLSGASSP